MRELTVGAAAVRALLEFAASRGASREELAARSGIEPADVQDRDQRVPFSRYVKLMHAGQELCRDPALALHFGESVPVSEITLPVGAYSESMTEGMALMNRYSPLTIEVGVLGDGDRFVFEREGDDIWIIDRRESPNDFPELTESGFARMISTGRQMFGGRSLVKAVHMTHAEPPYRAEYDRIFQVPIVFRSHRNALQTDASWMAMTPPSPSRPVLDVLRAHSETQLEKLESSKSLRGRIEGVLLPLLPEGKATMDAVATLLGVSRPSLFRKLKAEGATFEEILDGLRHKLALRYLGEEGVAVKEAAFRLGFSEPASFSRAFKRWTGTSPVSARRKKDAGAG